jgi:hypothetical protein
MRRSPLFLALACVLAWSRPAAAEYTRIELTIFGMD